MTSGSGSNWSLEVSRDRSPWRTRAMTAAGSSSSSSAAIRVVTDGQVAETPFLDITDSIMAGGERGLLGLAFHPDFETNGRFFVDYSATNGDQVIAEYGLGLDADTGDPDSERILIRLKDPFSNHNGGGLAFGPDGYLYIAMGDGGSGGDPLESGESLDTLLGKILRIDVDGTDGDLPYAIPADNPFRETAGARPEIGFTGLRNPWRFAFDRMTGDLWIGDVGQGGWEEIDVARAGRLGLDYGWDHMEGRHCFEPRRDCEQAGLTTPVAEYGHDQGCTIVGGPVYRGTAVPARGGRVVRRLLQRARVRHRRRRTRRAGPDAAPRLGAHDQLVRRGRSRRGVRGRHLERRAHARRRGLAAGGRSRVRRARRSRRPTRSRRGVRRRPASVKPRPPW